VTPQGARFAWFLGMAAALSLVMCAIGWVPTSRLAGPDGILAMVLGCGIGLAAAVAAVAFLATMAAETPEARMQRAFLAMFVRLVAAVLLGTAAVLSGEVARQPLLVWIAVAHVVLLPLEVRLAIV
jgi:hypothetical protein